MKSLHRSAYPPASLLAACASLSLAGCHHGQTTTAAMTTPSIASVASSAPPQPEPLPPGGVKGIYLSGWTAGTTHRFAELVDLVDRTEINAMVIDVKDDGQISYAVDVPLVKDVVAQGMVQGNTRMIRDIDKMLATLKAHHIFPIARIACFRDTPLASAHPEMAVHDANGKLWHDKTGHAWLNPYNQAACDYNVDIALDALKHGFKEIQFDYVRFPSEGKITTLQYPGRPKDSFRRDRIEAFLSYAREKIKAQGGWFSADVFGLTSLVKTDMGIGQTSLNVAKHVDYLCPMVYPSHYHKGEYGIKNPVYEPYKIVYLSVGDAQKNLAEVPTCKLRPWIQDEKVYGVAYGPAQVKAQIKALNDLGIKEFLMWSSRNQFTEAALKKEAAPAMAKSP